MLASLGVSDLAETVYMAILANPRLGVDRLAALLDIDVSEIRGALDELMDLALLAEGSDSGLRAVSPQVGLVDLVAKAEAEMFQRQRQLEATRAAVQRLASAQNDARARRQLVVLSGVDAVRGRIEELARMAAEECVSLNPNVSQPPDAKTASIPLNGGMLGRGLAIRCVYQDSYRNDSRLVAYAKDFIARGGELRTVPLVPVLMVIYDRAVALLPIDPDNSRAGAYEIRTESVVRTAYALFEQTWTSAVPVSELVTVPHTPEFDPRMRTLVEILAGGGTDEMAARKLGVSTRTVKRMSAELLEMLRAKSRFEAGMRAAQRGWI